MDILRITTIDRFGRTLMGIGTLVVGICPAMAGCNARSDSLPVLKVYDVKGKVLLTDGKPLTRGTLYFVPKGDLAVTPNAVVGTDGTFSVVTGGSGEGAPAGDYKVRVETPDAHPAQKSRRALVPFKYTDEDTSGIVVTVRPQATVLDPIKLK